MLLYNTYRVSPKSILFPYFSFRKRKRRTDVVVVRGRLRLYSASGFFLLLGLVILAIGIGMATLGYWPHGRNIATGGGNGVSKEKDVANTSHNVQGKDGASPPFCNCGAQSHLCQAALYSSNNGN